jgi:hypothetical protein
MAAIEIGQVLFQKVLFSHHPAHPFADLPTNSAKTQWWYFRLQKVDTSSIFMSQGEDSGDAPRLAHALGVFLPSPPLRTSLLHWSFGRQISARAHSPALEIII